MKKLPKLLTVTLKLFLSLLFGFLLIALVMKNDSMVRRAITKRFNPFFSWLLTARTSFEVKRISLFPFSVELENVVVDPHHGDEWSWSCSSLTFCCPWFDFLLYGTLTLDLQLKDVQAYTTCDNDKLPLWRHICGLYEGDSRMPTFLRSLTIENGTIDAHHISSGAQMLTTFALKMRTMDNMLKGNVRFNNGKCLWANSVLVDDFSGPIRFDVLSQCQRTHVTIRPKLTFLMPQLLNHKSCYLSGVWQDDHGLFSIKNDDRSLLVSPIKIRMALDAVSSSLEAHLPALYLVNLITQRHDQLVSGRCKLRMTIDFSSIDSAVKGTLTAGALYSGATLLTQSCHLSFKRSGQSWLAGISLLAQNETHLFGTGTWDESTGKGSINLRNKTMIHVPGSLYWDIMPNDFTTCIDYASDGIQGVCRCIAKNKKIEQQFVCAGTALWKNETVRIHGLIDDKHFCLEGDVEPVFHLRQCTYGKVGEKPIVAIRESDKYNPRFAGTVTFPLVHELLLKLSGYDLQGQGEFKIDGDYQDNKLVAQLKLVNGTIRLPHTYNFINNLSTRLVIDPCAYRMTMHDMTVNFHRGTVYSKQATVLFDDNYQVTYVHVPILFHDCLLNWQKDLFVVASGHLTFQKKHQQQSLHGSVFVDRAQLKQNIFSHDFQQRVFDSSAFSFQQENTDLLLVLKIKTKEPIRVKTSFLQTSVHVDMAIDGSVRKPNIVGNLSLAGGSLAFPYKPLYITKGSIDFVSGQPYNPFIELVAKNKLKKYNVSLQVSGSVSEQQITLESSPSLAQEQIFSLLLAGSHQESLNMVMPALVMQNVKNIIFGSDQSPTNVRDLFGNLFKPFEKIRLVPSFTDQTGRGGLRGAIEIDVSERWRAMIQKNFSLTEDTRVEVEYLLSDDISLKTERNERGDVSGQVEMRWKF